MENNVLRVAELLKKKELSRAERNEGINLAGAMFGTASRPHGDAVMVALKTKKATDGEERAAAAGSHTVIGVNTNTGVAATLDSQEQVEALDELAAGEFKLGEDVYAERMNKAGKAYYLKNGKPVKAVDFEAAKAEATKPSEPVDEDENDTPPVDGEFKLGEVIYKIETGDDGVTNYMRGEELISEADYLAAKEQAAELDSQNN